MFTCRAKASLLLPISKEPDIPSEAKILSSKCTDAVAVSNWAQVEATKYYIGEYESLHRLMLNVLIVRDDPGLSTPAETDGGKGMTRIRIEALWTVEDIRTRNMDIKLEHRVRRTIHNGRPGVDYSVEIWDDLTRSNHSCTTSQLSKSSRCVNAVELNGATVQATVGATKIGGQLEWELIRFRRSLGVSGKKKKGLKSDTMSITSTYWDLALSCSMSVCHLSRPHTSFFCQTRHVNCLNRYILATSIFANVYKSSTNPPEKHRKWVTWDRHIYVSPCWVPILHANISEGACLDRDGPERILLSATVYSWNIACRREDSWTPRSRGYAASVITLACSQYRRKGNVLGTYAREVFKTSRANRFDA